LNSLSKTFPQKKPQKTKKNPQNKHLPTCAQNPRTRGLYWRIPPNVKTKMNTNSS